MVIDPKTVAHGLLNCLVAMVWLGNGLFCKVLGLVPRHEEIVAGITGTDHPHALTQVIGFLEILMAIWVGSGILSRVCALSQIVVILMMNLLEFFLVPELLLWGRFNLLFAFLFAALICVNEFLMNERLKPTKADVLRA